MKKDSRDQQFFVGDRVKFALRNGQIKEGVIRAVILTTKGPELNMSFGPKGDLAATVNARQVVEKLPAVN
jgi:hypothetical protein